MKEEFVNYNQALALKELGFNEECFKYYIETGECVYASYSKHFNIYPKNSDLMPEWASTPLKQQVFRWFRDKYTLYSIISTIMHTYPNLEFYFKIQGINHGAMTDKFQTYEEAESACIDKLIEILKDK